MKKIIPLSFTIIIIFFIVFSVILWLTGGLYLRMSNVIVTANGIVSERSEVYKTGNGIYLIFLENNGTNKTYMIFSKNNTVGIPARPVPSSYSKSFKTNSFVLCLDCPVTLAGTDKLTEMQNLVCRQMKSISKYTKII